MLDQKDKDRVSKRVGESVGLRESELERETQKDIETERDRVSYTIEYRLSLFVLAIVCISLKRHSAQ